MGTLGSSTGAPRLVRLSHAGIHFAKVATKELARILSSRLGYSGSDSPMVQWLSSLVAGLADGKTRMVTRISAVGIRQYKAFLRHRGQNYQE
jgi:hypothetical protein